MNFKKQLLEALENDPIFAMRLSNMIGNEIVNNTKASYYTELEDFNVDDLCLDFKEYSEDDIRNGSTYIFVDLLRSSYDLLLCRIDSKKKNKDKSCRNIYSTFFIQVKNGEYQTTEDLSEAFLVQDRIISDKVYKLIEQYPDKMLYDILLMVEEEFKGE